MPLSRLLILCLGSLRAIAVPAPRHNTVHETPVDGLEALPLRDLVWQDVANRPHVEDSTVPGTSPDRHGQAGGAESYGEYADYGDYGASEGQTSMAIITQTVITLETPKSTPSSPSTTDVPSIGPITETPVPVLSAVPSGGSSTITKWVWPSDEPMPESGIPTETLVTITTIVTPTAPFQTTTVSAQLTTLTIMAWSGVLTQTTLVTSTVFAKPSVLWTEDHN